MELTPRQADILLVIRNWKHLHGHSPSVREIAASLAISRATTVAHLKAMRKKNLITWHARHARTLEVVADIAKPPDDLTPKRTRGKTPAPTSGSPPS